MLLLQQLVANVDLGVTWSGPHTSRDLQASQLHIFDKSHINNANPQLITILIDMYTTSPM